MHSTVRRIGLPHRVISWAVAGVVLSALFAFVALAVYQAERNGQVNIEERFRLRAELGETILSAYVQDVLRRARSVAELELSSSTVSDEAFATVAHASGFDGAVILDAAGKLTHVYPANQQIRGSQMATRYVHLRTALENGSAVSDVVASAAVHAPVVAFATRFHSVAGPRLFSGAFDVRATPLSSYMASLLGVSGANADLIDSHGVIVASNRKLTPKAHALADIDPALSKALSAAACDDYEDKICFQRGVTGTPWSLAISVEKRALYAPLGGDRRWLQWALFGAFCLATMVAVLLLWRLRTLGATHAILARVDRMTDLPNRLHLEEHMIRLVSAALRQKRPFSIFIVDVDHFKSVNDSFGHRGGDEVLRILAARMTSALRAEDMIGRWGGEEFLALLPNTSAEGACTVANRVRAMASSSPVILPEGSTLRVTVSIGCATMLEGWDSDYLQRADQALYSAKTQGRDRVVSSNPPAPAPAPAAQALAATRAG
jgi:diguanylate cyclase (GGDEF)-like protein